MCQLFETIRIESGEVHFLRYHQSRVDRSIGVGHVDLLAYISALNLPQTGCHKLKIVYDERGVLQHKFSPYQARVIRSFKVVADDHIEYGLKYDDRSAIERLQGRRGCCDDIIIVKNGLVCDASFANIALFNGQVWATPIKPLLNGTCRDRLVKQGVLIEQNIEANELWQYQKIVLINAMLGFDAALAVDISGLSVVK